MGTSRRRRRCRNKLCLSTTTCISRSAFPLLRGAFVSFDSLRTNFDNTSRSEFLRLISSPGERDSRCPKKFSNRDSIRFDSRIAVSLVSFTFTRREDSSLHSRIPKLSRVYEGAGSRCASSLQRRRVMTKNRGKWIKFVCLFFRIRISFFLFFFLSWHVRGFRWISTVIPFREI